MVGNGVGRVVLRAHGAVPAIAIGGIEKATAPRQRRGEEHGQSEAQDARATGSQGGAPACPLQLGDRQQWDGAEAEGGHQRGADRGASAEGRHPERGVEDAARQQRRRQADRPASP